MRGPGRADIANAGSGESGYSECGGGGRADIGSGGGGSGNGRERGGLGVLGSGKSVREQ
ncbi:unnamed protein product, partial [Staurois parvus]